MPSKSWKQARMMEKAAKDPEYAISRGVPVDVAKNQHAEDLSEGVYFDADDQLIPDPEQEG